jgi:putative hemolysin
MDLIIEVTLILACLIASAFFSGSEAALLRLRPHDVDRDVRIRSAPAVLAVRELLKSTSRLLVTILFGNNVVNILGVSVASALAVYYLGTQWGVLVATVSMTILVLIFSEILPKAVAARNPTRFAYAIGLPLYLTHQIARPIHLLFDLYLEPLIQRVSGGTGAEAEATLEDVLRLARRAGGGEAEGTPLAIIGAAAAAAKRTVTEIMVPRLEIVSFPATMAPADLLEQMLAERYTRVPIYEDSIDRVLGVLHLKDLVKLVKERGEDLPGILKPVLRVPERKLILELLTEMQRAFVHLAIVKDDAGCTEGLVTQEDILEELVGEIRDEFDREELLTIRKIGPDEFEALGRVKVLDFNRASGWSVPAERGDSLSGLVFNQLGRAPQKRDSVQVPGFTLEVVDVSGVRITRLRVRREPRPGVGDGSATPDRTDGR